MSVVDDEALSMRWLAARIAPVRGWIVGAAISGVLATAAYATFAAAIAQLIGRWSRGDLSASGWLLAFAIPAALIARSVLHAIREWSSARSSVTLRLHVRDEVLDAIAELGPLRSSAGSDGVLATVLVDQVDALDGYVSRYRPQQLIVMAAPILIAALVFPSSWLAALILIGTAPLIPMFMVLVGRQAAAASSQQAGALARLGGQFLDLVRGLPSLRLLGRVDAGAERLDAGAQDYRRRSMQVLRIAFLSSAVLELFASIAIAMVALYLGLALLGRFDVGHYGTPMTLDKALFIMLLAPEFFIFFFPPDSLGTLKLLSQIGVCLSMFTVGMELELGQLGGTAQTAVVVSHAGIVIHYFLGVVLANFLYESLAQPGASFKAFALFMGIS